MLFLQHPQEPDEHLGSARLAHLALTNSTLRVGLSWPNLNKALGSEARPSRWAVLYLGSGIRSEKQPSLHPSPGLHFVTKAGAMLETSATEIAPEIDGLIVLDGTWSQAKTLWWRNAWLLKLRRVVLVPSHPSLYGALRREPRRECLSTIESVAESLVSLGEPESVGTELRALFAALLDQQRARLRAR